jgi:hypothetical protein
MRKGNRAMSRNKTNKQPNKRWTDGSDFTDKELGKMYGWLEDMHDAWKSGHGCPCGIVNRSNIKWMWLSICGLGLTFGAAFTFLYAGLVKIEHALIALGKT